MTSPYFVDASVFFLVANKLDLRGDEILSWIKTNQPTLYTTNLIWAETVSLVTKRIGKKSGVETGELILESGIVHLEFIDEFLFKEAWTFYKKYKDKDFDLIDATSFVFCRKRVIKEVLTLDRHFAQMGFKVFPPLN